MFALAIGAALLAALLQDISPSARPILEIIALSLPAINRYLTEWLKGSNPELAERLGGRVLSRNVGVIVFGIFAAVGLVAAPDVALPASPTSYDLLDWLGYVSSLLTAAVALLAYTISGSRKIHDAIKGDDEAPEPPSPPAPPEPPATTGRGAFA